MAVHSYIHVTFFFFWGGGGGGGGVGRLGVKMYGGLCRFDFVIGLGSVLNVLSFILGPFLSQITKHTYCMRSTL